MTWDERKAETMAVLERIRGRLGEQTAHDWLWSCTPFPCDLPSEEQLAEGDEIADGYIKVEELMARVEDEMLAALPEGEGDG